MNTRKFLVNKNLLLLLPLLFAFSCTTLTNGLNDYYASDLFVDKSEAKTGSSPELTETQVALVNAALESTSMPYSQTFIFQEKEFSNDCSGLIYGIFWQAGIDLIYYISQEKGNGVKRIHSVLDKRDLIHSEKLPSPGDLVFWSNTYGSWGKMPLSHIGIVVSVDKESGSIEYVHNNTYLGAVRKETMNLYHPHETRPVNNYMRYDSKYKKTAAELFDSFGRAWRLE